MLSPSSEAWAMNVDRWPLSTNAIVAFLAGAAALAGQLHTANYMGISIIGRMGFLAVRGLTWGGVDAFAVLHHTSIVGLMSDMLMFSMFSAFV